MKKRKSGKLLEFKKRPNTNNKFPWRNVDGSYKSDGEIAQLGKSWSAKTWDEYLKDTIEISKNRNDQCFYDMDTEFILEKAEVMEILKSHKYDNMKDALNLAFDSLSNMERTVIRYSFWEGMDDKMIAKVLNTTHGAVRVHKSCAIRRLRRILPSKHLKMRLQVLQHNRETPQEQPHDVVFEENHDLEDKLLKAS